MLSAATGMLLPIPGLSLRAAYGATGISGGSCPVPGKDIISPPTRPWLEELPRLVEKQTCMGNDPANIYCGHNEAAQPPGPARSAP